MRRVVPLVLAALLAGCASEGPAEVTTAATLPAAALGRPATALFEENLTLGVGVAGRTLPERARDVFPACPAGATGILVEMRWRDATPRPVAPLVFLEAHANGQLLSRIETTDGFVRLELAPDECARGPLRVRYGASGASDVPSVAVDARVTLSATAFLDGPPDWSYSGLPRE